MAGSVTWTVDVEWWYHAVVPPEEWVYYSGDQTGLQTIYRLVEVFKRHRVTATFYVLGIIAQQEPSLLAYLLAQGHVLGSHGFWHQREECAGDVADRLARTFLPECVGYRGPYWGSTPRPGYAGGAYFRFLPYPFLLWEARRSRAVYLHPHDLDLHPGMLRRTLSLGDPWQKLERLLGDLT